MYSQVLSRRVSDFSNADAPARPDNFYTRSIALFLGFAIVSAIAPFVVADVVLAK